MVPQASVSRAAGSNQTASEPVAGSGAQGGDEGVSGGVGDAFAVVVGGVGEVHGVGVEEGGALGPEVGGTVGGVVLDGGASVVDEVLDGFVEDGGGKVVVDLESGTEVVEVVATDEDVAGLVVVVVTGTDVVLVEVDGSVVVDVGLSVVVDDGVVELVGGVVVDVVTSVVVVGAVLPGLVVVDGATLVDVDDTPPVVVVVVVAAAQGPTVAVTSSSQPGSTPLPSPSVTVITNRTRCVEVSWGMGTVSSSVVPKSEPSSPPACSTPSMKMRPMLVSASS